MTKALLPLLLVVLLARPASADCRNDWSQPAHHLLRSAGTEHELTTYANGDKTYATHGKGRPLDLIVSGRLLLARGYGEYEIPKLERGAPAIFAEATDILAKAAPAGPCAVAGEQQASLALGKGGYSANATVKIARLDSGEIGYAIDVFSAGDDEDPFITTVGMLSFAAQPSALPDDTNVVGYRLIDGIPPFPAIGGLVLPPRTLGELRRVLAAQR